MARDVEILHKSDAFEKEAERVRHLFKAQGPDLRVVEPQLLEMIGGAPGAAVVYLTTSDAPSGRYWPPITVSTGIHPGEHR